MTLKQALFFWQIAPVLFVIGVLLAMCAACYLTCLCLHLWHRLTRPSEDYRTLCTRIISAL